MAISIANGRRATAAAIQTARLAAIAAIALTIATNSWPVKAQIPTSGRTEIALLDTSHGYMLSSNINDIPVYLQLDTGADDVCLSNETAAELVRLGALSGEYIGGFSRYRTANGSTGWSRNISIRKLKIGRSFAYNVKGSVGCAQSLLGQTFLKRFGSYTIDNQRHVLILSNALGDPNATSIDNYRPSAADDWFIRLAEGNYKAGARWLMKIQHGAYAALDCYSLYGKAVEESRAITRDVVPDFTGTPEERDWINGCQAAKSWLERSAPTRRVR